MQDYVLSERSASIGGKTGCVVTLTFDLYNLLVRGKRALQNLSESIIDDLIGVSYLLNACVLS